MGAGKERKRFFQPFVQQLFHGDTACEFAADRRFLPEGINGRQAVFPGLGVDAAVFQPVKPFLCGVGVSGHVVVDAGRPFQSFQKGAAEQKPGLRERAGKVPDILFPRIRKGHGRKTFARLHMPFAPVPKTSHLHKADEAIAAVPLPESRGGLFMRL